MADIYNPETLTVAQVIAAYDAGLLVRTGGGVYIERRQCIDCGRRLPVVTIDGGIDTFPRCSRHAF